MISFKAALDSAYFDAYEEEFGNGKPHVRRITIWWWAVKTWVKWSTTELVCHLRGHNIVSEGYANAESGCDDHSCSRCGRYWSVPLY